MCFIPGVIEQLLDRGGKEHNNSHLSYIGGESSSYIEVDPFTSVYVGSYGSPLAPSHRTRRQ